MEIKWEQKMDIDQPCISRTSKIGSFFYTIHVLIDGKWYSTVNIDVNAVDDLRANYILTNRWSRTPDGNWVFKYNNKAVISVIPIKSSY